MENEQDGFLCKRAIEAQQRGGYQPRKGEKPCNPPKSTNTFNRYFDRGKFINIDIPETLNKREMIAAMAMQGMLASASDSVEGNVARWAVEYADELLAELEKTK